MNTTRRKKYKNSYEEKEKEYLKNLLTYIKERLKRSE